MPNLKFIDWPFFVALFLADIAGVCARRFNRAYDAAE
jgi:hypothetical protein